MSLEELNRSARADPEDFARRAEYDRMRARSGLPPSALTQVEEAIVRAKESGSEILESNLWVAREVIKRGGDPAEGLLACLYSMQGFLKAAQELHREHLSACPSPFAHLLNQSADGLHLQSGQFSSVLSTSQASGFNAGQGQGVHPQVGQPVYLNDEGQFTTNNPGHQSLQVGAITPLHGGQGIHPSVEMTDEELQLYMIQFNHAPGIQPPEEPDEEA